MNKSVEDNIKERIGVEYSVNSSRGGSQHDDCGRRVDD